MHSREINDLVKFANGYSIKGLSLPIGESHPAQDRMTPVKLETQAYRQINGRPVFHVCENKVPFQVPDFVARKVHRWGLLYHPMIVLASYEIGGVVRFYVDTRVPEFFLLWTATRIDDTLEFPGVSHDLVAWMPRIKGDSVSSAGFLLTHAAMLSILSVDKDDWYCDPGMAKGMQGSEKVAVVIGSIAPTVHKSANKLRSRLKTMPDYLRPLFQAHASVGGDENVYGES